MMGADGSIYHTTDIELEATDSWMSPETDQVYGMTWTLRETKRDLDLGIQTRFPQQEIILLKDVPAYTWQIWEGGTTVSGEIDGSPVSGIGYAELVPHILAPGLTPLLQPRSARQWIDALKRVSYLTSGEGPCANIAVPPRLFCLFEHHYMV